MKPNAIFIAYYIYLMFLIAGTAYLVFWKGIDPWWWALTLALSQIQPRYSQSN